MSRRRLFFTRKRPWPFPACSVDIDFVNQRYFWSGAYKATSNFTTYTLNGSTFGPGGLTPTDTIDVTLTLPAETYVPGSYCAAFTHASAPGTSRTIFQLDDGGNTNRVTLQQATSLLLTNSVTVSNVSQASATASATAPTGIRHGFASSYDTNDFRFSGNGVAGTADTSGTIPTVTRLQIGRSAGGTACTGAIGRIVLFNAVKTNFELHALAVAMRDGA